MGIIQIAQRKEVREVTRGHLEAGEFGEVLARIGESQGGGSQLVAILSAEAIINIDLDWKWPIQRYDTFVQDLIAKYGRYGKKMFPLTDAQREWAADFLQAQFDRAAA